MRNTASIVLLAAASSVAMGGIVSIEGGFVKTTPDANDPLMNHGSADYVQGFAELANITLTEDIAVQLGDGSMGSLEAGTVVNSHMVYFDPEGDDLVTISDIDIEFDGEILGLIVNDEVMVATHDLLGLEELNYYYGTDMNYGPNGAPDIELFSGSTLNVSLRASAGDYFRVLTSSNVPSPSALAMLGLGGLVAGRRRR